MNNSRQLHQSQRSTYLNQFNPYPFFSWSENNVMSQFKTDPKGKFCDMLYLN